MNVLCVLDIRWNTYLLLPPKFKYLESVNLLLEVLPKTLPFELKLFFFLNA